MIKVSAPANPPGESVTQADITRRLSVNKMESDGWGGSVLFLAYAFRVSCCQLLTRSSA